MTDATITTHEGSLDSWLRLAAELERIQVRPSDVQVKNLAKELGLDLRTVRSAIKLRFGQERNRRGVIERFGDFLLRLSGWPVRLIQPLFDKQPYVTATVVALVFGVLIVMAAVPLGMLSSMNDSTVMGAMIAAGVVSVLLGYFLYQGALLFNKADVNLATRLAFFLAALPMALIAPTLVLVFLFLPTGSEQPARWEVVLAIPMVYLALAVFLAPIFVFAAALGGYSKALRRMSEERDADRQTLLKRVFDLRSRLGTEEECGPGEVCETDREMYTPHPVFRYAATRPFVSALVAVVALSAMDTLARMAWYGWLRDLVKAVNPLVDLLGLMLFVVGIVVMFQVGAAIGTLRRAAATGFAIAVGVVLSYLVVVVLPPTLTAPDASHSVAAMFRHQWFNMAVSVLAYYVPMLAGAMTGAYGDYVRQERLLASNDRLAIASEIERLRGKLQRENQQAHFLSVDVVGSTAMKVNEDPLAVEYTFTEFHRFVAQRVLDAGGVVRSTAGDGALAAFRGAADAIEAALSIQGDLEGFNRAQNSLANPFQLRVGIHGDTVAGDAPTVSYSNAIDIAVHVERACPAGRVAVTVQALESAGRPLAHQRLDATVDGLAVAILSPADEREYGV